MDKLHVKTSHEEIMQQLSINLVSAMLCSKIVLRSMLVAQSGSIVNIGNVRILLALMYLCIFALMYIYFCVSSSNIYTAITSLSGAIIEWVCF